MKGSIKLGTVFGIPIKLHFTLIFIVILVAWSIGANVLLLADMLGIEDPGITTGLQSYTIGLVLAVGLFVSVLIHEMAHSIVSIKNGIKVNEISLWLFGGVSALEEIPRDPNLEIKVSAVGPLSSLGIALFCFIGGMLTTHGILTFMLLYTSFINFFLAGFNLIPAFPMDGGRILRALLAKKYPYIKATKAAADVGKAFAVLLGIIGLFFNIFLILIAFFIYIAASQESQSVLFKEVLSRINVRNIMSEDVKTVSPDITIEEFIKIVIKLHHTGFPVVSSGKVVGIVTMSDSKKVPDDMIYTTKVGQVMEENIICVSPDDNVGDIWETMMKEQFGRFPVMDGDELVGIITRSDILHSFNVLSEVEKVREEEF